MMTQQEARVYKAQKNWTCEQGICCVVEIIKNNGVANALINFLL